MKQICNTCECCGREVVKRPLTPEQLGFTLKPRIVMSATSELFHNIPNVTRYTKITPLKRPSTNAHVWTPFWQAFLSGMFMFFVFSFVSWWRSWPLYWPFFIWSVTSLGAWIVSQEFYKNLMSAQEIIEAGDPDPPTPEPVTHIIEIRDRKTNTTIFAEVPITIDKMKNVATAVLLPGGKFSRGYLCKSRGILSQPDYNKLRSWMLKNQLIEEMANKSNRIRPVGRAVFRQIRDEK